LNLESRKVFARMSKSKTTTLGLRMEESREIDREKTTRNHRRKILKNYENLKKNHEWSYL